MQHVAPLLMSTFFGFALLSCLAGMYRAASRHGFGPVVAAPVSGAIVGLVGWLMLNGSSRVNGVGFLERSEIWPLPNFYLTVAAVAALATAAAVAGFVASRSRRGSIAAEAKDAGLAYREAVRPEEVAEYGLKLFENFSRGSDAVRGEVAGVPYLAFDLKTRERFGSGNKQRTVDRFRTVVTIPAPKDAAWAPFQVEPAGMLASALATSSALRLKLQEDRQALPEERTLLARFEERYAIEGRLADAERIAKHFDWRAVRFFASEAGWSVECSGTHLVFSRGWRTLNARDRKSLIGASAQLYDALRPVDAPPLRVVSGFQPNAVPRLGFKAAAAALGVFASGAIAMFATFFAFGVALVLADDESRTMIGFAWPPAGMFAFVAGAYGGWRVIKRFAGVR